MDIFSNIKDPLGSKNKVQVYGTLNATGVNIPTQSEWMKSIGVNPSEFSNLTGVYLTYWQNCKAAEAVYNTNLAAYNAYMTALDTYNTKIAQYGCPAGSAPPTPTLQVLIPNPSGVCDTQANAAASAANTGMQTAYNSAKSTYDTKVANCNATVAPTPAVANPGTFTYNPTPPTGPAADGNPQWFGAAGYRKFRNCSNCTGANGHRNATGTTPSLLTIALVVGAGYLAYKYFIKK